MNLNELYNYAEAKNIHCGYDHQSEKAGYCFIMSQKAYIVLNKKILGTTIKEKCVLAEELGHLETGSLFYLTQYYNPIYTNNVARAARKTSDWKASHLVDLNKLKLLISSEITLAELAEEFEVDQQTILDAIDYYKRKGLIKQF